MPFTVARARPVSDRSRRSPVLPQAAVPDPGGFAQGPLPPVGARGETRRQEDVVRVAGLPAVLQDGNDAGGTLSCRRRSFAVLPLQRFAHILGIGGEALRGRHHAVDVDGEAPGARGAGRAGRDQGDPRGDFGGPVFLAGVGGLGRSGRFRRDGDAWRDLGSVVRERRRPAPVRGRTGGEEAGSGGLVLVSAVENVRAVFSLEAPRVRSPARQPLLSARPGERHGAGPGALLEGRVDLAPVSGHAPGRGFGAAPGQEPPLVAGEKLHLAVGRLIGHELLRVGRGREGLDFSIRAPERRRPSLRGRDNLVSLVEPQDLIGTSAGSEDRLGDATCREENIPRLPRRPAIAAPLYKVLLSVLFPSEWKTILRGRKHGKTTCSVGGKHCSHGVGGGGGGVTGGCLQFF